MKVLDVETTGLNVDKDDRIVSIGVLDIVTGATFYQCVNPGRSSCPEALRIHQLSDEFLSSQKTFSEIAENLLMFIGNDIIVAHNAPFDMTAVNTELKRCERGPLNNKVIDTLALARSMFPGERCSLDNLCKRLSIDRGGREDKHDALHDCSLTKELFLKLTSSL